MEPSIGRIVHYVDDLTGQPTCHAAIITEVVEPPGEAHFGIVNLTVFRTDSTTVRINVSRVEAENKTVRSWHWPERA